MKKLSDIRVPWPVMSAIYGAGIGGLGVHYFGKLGFIGGMVLAGLIGYSIERQRVRDSNLPFSREAFEDFGKEILKRKSDKD